MNRTDQPPCPLEDPAAWMAFACCVCNWAEMERVNNGVVGIDLMDLAHGLLAAQRAMKSSAKPEERAEARRAAGVAMALHLNPKCRLALAEALDAVSGAEMKKGMT